MVKPLERLIEIAGPQLNRDDPTLSPSLVERAQPWAAELCGLLNMKNGFYVFESALHVFPAQSTPSAMGLDRWNSSGCWRSTYGELVKDCLFFAEDIFGGQFALKPGGVFQFDPETADQEFIASGLDTWAEAVLADYEVLTGYQLAHRWQVRHGPITPGERLVPKLPFVVGGEFSIDNLYQFDAVEGMRLRGSIATQICDLPDGAELKFEIVD